MEAREALERGINALMRSDAEELARLVELAPGARWPEAGPERQAVQERQRTLGKLLALTRRNQRLLGGEGGAWAGYGVWG